MTLARLWPVVNGQEILNTELWAVRENLRILASEREALNVVTKNMLEMKQVGRLVLDLERALADRNIAPPVVE